MWKTDIYYTDTCSADVHPLDVYSTAIYPTDISANICMDTSADIFAAIPINIYSTNTSRFTIDWYVVGHWELPVVAARVTKCSG